MGKQVKIYNLDNLKTVDFTKLVELQDDLKDLSKDDYEKLKSSILTKGFRFNFRVWDDNGTLYIHDGHQRQRVLRELRKDGYLVEPVPYEHVYAENKKDAVELLLIGDSRFGKATYQGMYELAEKYKLDMEYVETKISYPKSEINMQTFVNAYYRDIPGQDDDKDKTGSPVYITCPECKFKWEGGKV